MPKFKRLFLVTLALSLVLGCLAGCGNQTGPGFPSLSDPTAPSVAMGRYVEHQIPIPDALYPLDMVMLEDDRLRVAVQGEKGITSLYTLTADGGWDISPLPKEILDSGETSSLALSPDGTVFCYTTTSDENYNILTHRMWVVEPSGEYRELPNTYPDMESLRSYLIYKCDFTQSGKLLVLTNYLELRELDLQSGVFGDNRNESGFFPTYLGCAGEDTYVVGSEGGFVFGNGEAVNLSGALGEQILSTVAGHDGCTNGRFSIWANKDGYLFFVTNEGLFSALPEGSVTEELINGKRSSLGGPAFTPYALTGDEGGSFYVLAYDSSEVVLYRYDYDENMPTEPGTLLRVYSLKEDGTLQQAVSLFQKEHPDIAVDLEIGMTGEDGVTENDAIKALNTKILSGTGPDVLNLDDLPLDSFLEKGILSDLTPVLSESGEVLTNVTNCFAQDGKVCALPTGFTLPTIYGPEDIISQIHDMDSLISAVKQAKAENPKANRTFLELRAAPLADSLYDSCSAAWCLPDGTLDEEKLQEYYAGMKALYDMDADYRASRNLSSQDYTPGYLTNLDGALDVCLGAGCSVGMLYNMDWWSSALMGDQKLAGYEVLPLNVQATGVFLPQRVMGILDSSENKAAAEAFLCSMLGDGVQNADFSVGFPVSVAALEKQIAEDKESTSGATIENDDGTVDTYEGLYPDAARRQRLRDWAQSLTTPALTDLVIRRSVIEQAEACMVGRVSPEEAAKAAIRSLNLYLSE